MAKTYRTPSVASLGAAEVMTSGITPAPLPEPVLKTTHHMLDL